MKQVASVATMGLEPKNNIFLKAHTCSKSRCYACLPLKINSGSIGSSFPSPGCLLSVTIDKVWSQPFDIDKGPTKLYWYCGSLSIPSTAGQLVYAFHSLAIPDPEIPKSTHEAENN